MPTGKKKSNQNKDTIYLKDEHNSTVLADQTSDFINRFFTSIGPTLANKIDVDNTEYLNDLSNSSPPTVLSEWRLTDYVEVTKVIKEINVHKNSNIDKVNSLLLKDCLLSSIQQVAHLFNQIFITGQIPDTWKMATVIPLFKSGTKTSVSNYRPISLLPCIAKLMEKLIHNRLYYFLDDSQFFSNAQSGF